MTEKVFMISRCLFPLVVFLLAGCQQVFEFEIVGQETVLYDGEYSFPDEASYWEPEQGEQVVRFDVFTGDDLSTLHYVFDLNGYFVSVKECSTTQETETHDRDVPLAILAKPNRGAREEWAFFVGAHSMQRALIVLPSLAQAAETQNYCFKISGGSMTGASASSREVVVDASAMRDLLGLVEQ